MATSKNKNKMLMAFLLAMLFLASPLYAYDVNETTYAQADVNAGTVYADANDTAQIEVGLGNATSTSGVNGGEPPVWGNGNDAVDKGSLPGGDIFEQAFGNDLTISGDNSGAALDIVFPSAYTGGRTLDKIRIFTSADTNRVDYEFYVQYAPYDNWGNWSTITTVIGGPNDPNIGTVIEVNNISINDIYGVRIWSNPVSGQGATKIEEVDVYLVDPCSAPSNDYTGGVTKAELEGILDKAITIAPLAIGEDSIAPYFEDNMRMIKNLNPKLIGRAAYSWDVWHSKNDFNMADDDAFFQAAVDYAEQVHLQYPDLLLECVIFETAYAANDPCTPARIAMGFSGAGVEQIPVPVWVFDEFNEPNVTRNFSYDDMIYLDGRYDNHWLPGTSVPDIDRPEAQKWYYYRARRFIDAGYEAINLAQIALVSENDTGYTSTQSLINRIRNYAATNARRHWAFMSAHTHGIAVSGNLLFDFHGFPLRITEVSGSPFEGKLEMGYIDSIYGNSLGGVSPSGWSCDNLPYLVEFDNNGGSNDPNHNETPDDIWTWGWDEISWFAHQDEDYRNDWLWYANNWIAENDPNGYLMMPGARVNADLIEIAYRGLVWSYQANTFSDDCPIGFNQEETIKKIWYSGCTGDSKADIDDDCDVDFMDFAKFADLWLNCTKRFGTCN